MRTISRFTLAATIAFSLPAATPLPAQDSARVERPTSELITREQIMATKATNAREAVEQLHSNWLVARMPAPGNRATARMDTSKASYITDVQPSGRSNPGENGGIQVYLDGNRLGGIEELKNVRPGDIYSIRRINGVDAQARFGIGHGAGVLYISTISSRSQP